MRAKSGPRGWDNPGKVKLETRFCDGFLKAEVRMRIGLSQLNPHGAARRNFTLLPERERGRGLSRYPKATFTIFVFF